MAKVSIVLPTYNGERYLRASVDSVLAQTMRDWELWIVDDCSTDATGDIAEAYAAQDSRIHVLHNEVNRKVAASLNTGFRAATTPYLTWTSDDNVYHPTALEKMVDWLDAHPNEVMVCAGMRVVDADGAYLERWPTYTDQSIYVDDFVGACFLYRRCVWENVGEYDTSLFGPDDYDYWIRVVQRYGHIGYLPDVLYDYRHHAAALTVAKKDLCAQMLTSLRHKHFAWMMDGIAQHPAQVCRVFFQMQHGSATEEEREAFFERVPYLRAYQPASQLAPETRFLCWGAGQVGRKAAELYGKRILYFADANETREGTEWMGYPVYVLSALEHRKDKEIVMLTLGFEKIYSCFSRLQAWSVDRFTVFLEV